MVRHADERLSPDPDGVVPARRFALVALQIGVGYSIARFILESPSTFWLLAALLFGAVSIFVRGRWSSRALGLGVVCFAAGWFTLRIWETPAESLERRLEQSPRLIDVTGVISSDVRTPTRRGRLAPLIPRSPSTTFVLRTQSLTDNRGNLAPTSGSLRVFVRGELAGLRPGDIVSVRGMARGTRPLTNPGQIDLRLHARMNRHAGTIEVASPALVHSVDAPNAFFAGGLARAKERIVGLLRARASRWLDEDGAATRDPGTRALIVALALGQREAELSDLTLLFQRTGLAHVLAVSGLHLMVLIGTIALLLRALGARPVFEILILGIFIALYLLLVPARAPIVRAAIMALALLGASAGGRRYDRVTILGLAAVIVLLWRPLELWSMGFQLSFGVVAGLVTLARALREHLFGAPVDPDHRTIRDLVLDRAKDALASSLCAWLIATPILMHHVGLVAPLAVLSVLVVMPIVTLLLALSFGAAALSVLSPALGAHLAEPLQSFASILIDLVRWFDGLPGSTIHLPAIGAAWSVVALITIVQWMRPQGECRWLVLARAPLSALTVLWLATSLLRVGLPQDQALRLDTFDVGDGSCHLIRQGDDAMLFDCGSLKLDLGERTLPQAIRSVGAWRVPRVIISHANIDHFSALVDLARPLGIEEVLAGPSFIDDARERPAGAAAIVVGELESQGVRVRAITAGDLLALGDLSFEVLSPRADDAFDSANDRSLVLLGRVPTTNGERRFLLTGDIQRDAMRTLRDRVGSLDIDILEAPHHGSAHREAYDFVRWADPQLVVQSTGPSRLNDSRWDEVRQDHRWLSTAESGAISVIIGGDGEITTRSWRAGPLPDTIWRIGRDD